MLPPLSGTSTRSQVLAVEVIVAEVRQYGIDLARDVA
jgi:hypothetical protein